ncbi:PspC domain-containing protein [Streptococcus halotolerans]|uniref:PspC domain-containing protein n=1 Tax=Streptococcus halotolerans TaxID=1814128 RepID=UPI000A7A2F91
MRKILQISRKADLFFSALIYTYIVKIQDQINGQKESMMEDQFYRLKRGRVLAGVLAGLSDKFNWDLNLVRALFVISCLFAQFPIFIYIVLAIFLPYKEDTERDRFGSSKRRRKNARSVDSDNDGWYW